MKNLTDKEIFDILGIEEDNYDEYKHLLSQFRELNKKYDEDAIWLKGDAGISFNKEDIIDSTKDLVAVKESLKEDKATIKVKCIKDYMEDDEEGELWSKGCIYDAKQVDTRGNRKIETNLGTWGSIGPDFLLKDFDKYFEVVDESLKEDAEDIDVEAEVEVEEPKEDAKEPKLETFEEKIDFLVKDEDEAIAGYDKIIAMLDKEADANAIEQLNHIKEEEVAHKDFLEVLKKDPNAIYKHEDKEEPKENDDDKIEVSNTEFIDDIALDDIDDDFGESISESTDFDDDFGFNHIIDESEDDVKLGTVDWNDLDDDEDVLFKKVIKNTDDDILDKHFGKDTPERKLVGAVKDMKEDNHNTGHIKARKPIELKARVEK